MLMEAKWGCFVDFLEKHGLTWRDHEESPCH